MGPGWWMGWFIGLITAILFMVFVVNPSDLSGDMKVIVGFLVGFLFTSVCGAIGAVNDD